MALKVVVSSMGMAASAGKLLADAGCEIVTVEPTPGNSTWSAEEISRYFSDADAFVGPFSAKPITRAVLEGAPKLRLGASSVIGTETIDVVAATDLGICIAYGAAPENLLGVAEAIVMNGCALVKDLPRKWQAVREGGWRVETPMNMMWKKTFGLLGFGNIGQATAERLQGWQMRVIACDPYADGAAARRLGVEMVDFDTLMRESDVVSVMLVLNDQTHHLVSERALSLMKPTAYLINTSRGPCVDEQALLRALDAGTIAGAAIDVWEQEPTDKENPLRYHPKVIATGHNIGHSEEAYAALPPLAAENILRGLRGEQPVYVRNPEVLPAWRQRLERLGVIPLETSASP